jgi:hypothetical protein
MTVNDVFKNYMEGSGPEFQYGISQAFYAVI